MPVNQEYNATPKTLADKDNSLDQCDMNGNKKVVLQGGSIVSGAADSGNPVKVGGKYNATPPTLDDGDRGDMQLDVKGNVKITQATTLDKTNDSITNYPAGCNMTIIDLSAGTSQVVTGAPAKLLGCTVDIAMNAYAATIQDNAAVKVTIPASSAAGYDRNTRRASFATNITVVSNASSTGKIAIFWEAQ